MKKKKGNIIELGKNLDENEILDNLVIELDRGNFDLVIKESEKLLKDFPDQVKFYTLKAEALAAVNEIESSFNFLRKAEKKFPDEYQLLWQMASLYYEKNDFVKADKYFTKAIKNIPEELDLVKSNVLNEYAELKYFFGNDEEAVELWEKALELDPDNINAQNNLEDYYDSFEEDNEDDYDDNDNYDGELSHTGINEINYFMFKDIQKAKYLKSKNLEDFSSMEEEDLITDHIEAAWENKMQVILYNRLSEFDKESEKIYEDFEIDFSESVQDFDEPFADDSEIPEKFFNDLNKNFSFLPEQGVETVILSRPAMYKVGLNEKIISEIAGNYRKPTKEEKILFKWCYDIGKYFVDFVNETEDEKRELVFTKMLGKLQEKLSEADAIDVIRNITKKS